ncbi:MAG: hypothetical protein IE909_00185 [Campylobacterales bacterium]|nr:hypothetical protein [Campylobacterales bacterium]
MNNSGMVLRTGYKPVAIAFGVFVLSYLFDFDTLSFLGFIGVLFFLYYFRNENVYTPNELYCVTSPIDGKVVAIDKTDNQVKIYLQTSLLGIKKIVSPIGGDLKIKYFQNGANLSSFEYKSKYLNQQAELCIGNLTMKIIVGKWNTSFEINKEIKNVRSADTLMLANDVMVVLQFDKGDILVDIGENVTLCKQIAVIN